MKTDITIKIGGEAGQGIQTIGTLLAEVCHSAGLFIFSIDDFESRIRGGHSFNLLRLGNAPVMAPGHKIDILVAIDQRTLDMNKDSLANKSMVILNSDGESGLKDNVLSIPLKKLAKDAGGVITANTVAAGAALSILGTPFEMLEGLLKAKFSAKGEKIVGLNTVAARMGYDAAGDIRFQNGFNWAATQTDRVVINGAKAAALGALASDCRFFSFYPMSPATGVMSSVVPYADKLSVVVEQAEDEIAAVNMAVGASFAGVRSLTSTSGGGFCLMTEGLGLAAITETPLVVIDAQRPGPATGLPTRTAQPDLLFVINASQDYFPRFVFAPGSPLETFEILKKAFMLSEKYQVPAIVLMDQFLAGSQVTQDKSFHVDRNLTSFIVNDDDLDFPENYRRYALTEDGISPRALPCMGKAILRVTGNEHDENGGISEDASNKIRMSDKRNKKMDAMKKEIDPPEIMNGDAPFLLMGWGSTRGNIMEACTRLNSKGINVGCAVFKDIWPMDKTMLMSMFSGKKLIMVEQNANCQLGKLIAQETGIMYHDAILKDDGRPFYPEYIMERIHRLME